MNDLTVLDVGHGNCAIIHGGEDYAVVDSPTGSLLLNTLADFGVTKVESAIISHADKDHLAGILALLTSDDIEVENVYVNPDAIKNSEIWREFRHALTIAQRKGECRVHHALSSADPGTIVVGDIIIEVVAPSLELVLGGPGSKDRKGRTITTNSASAVLHLKRDKGSGVLLAGDLDEIGLDDALANEAQLSASVLVFPHHGGLAGSRNPTAFTNRLLEAVKPVSIVFSNGRNRYDNPHPAIIETASRTGCKVACTQMSSACWPSNKPIPQDHLEDIRSKGKHECISCAGSMSYVLASIGGRQEGHENAHKAFIETYVPSPMCLSSER